MVMLQISFMKPGTVLKFDAILNIGHNRIFSLFRIHVDVRT